MRADLRLAEPVRNLLDREAGFFRLGPFGLNVPAARAYEPRTNTFVTTWHAPAAWAVVRNRGDRAGRHDVSSRDSGR